MRFLIVVLILCPLFIFAAFHLKDVFPMMVAEDRYTVISATIVASIILIAFAGARILVLLSEKSAEAMYANNQLAVSSQSVFQPRSKARYSSSNPSHRSTIQSSDNSSSSTDHLLIHAALLSSYGGSTHSHDFDSCHDATTSDTSDSSCSASSD
jgi:hypothetical protein